MSVTAEVCGTFKFCSLELSGIKKSYFPSRLVEPDGGVPIVYFLCLSPISCYVYIQYTYTHTHMYTHTHIYMYTYTHTHTHIYTYTHIYTHVYTHTHTHTHIYIVASLVGQAVKNLLQCQRPMFNPWVGKIPWRREWPPSPGF